MSDHAEKFAAFVVWANADDDPGASWTMARWQAKVLVAERDGLRARVEQLGAELDNFKAALQLANKNTERRGRKCERLEAALRQALDCRGSFNGTVSERGGEPAICTKCEATARAALSGLGEAG